MKTRNYLYSIALAALLPMVALTQSGLEKKTIATFGPGETLAYSESCFRLDLPSETFSFVTMTGSGDSKQYYCYGKDGSKTGPVKKPDPSYWAGRDEMKEDKCPADAVTHMAGMAEYADLGTGTVNFKGKTYGPHGTIIYFAQPDDEQSFFAVAMTAEMKLMGFDNFGRRIDLSGMPEDILVSPDGKNAVAKVRGSKSPLDLDYFQYIMDHPEEASNPGIFFYGFDGRNWGPYPSSSFRDAWYTESGQLVIFANPEVYLDGRLLGKTGTSVAACDLWISPDGKSFAWANYETLAFSDGSTYSAPLVLARTEENGRQILKWLTLEEGKNLVFYQRPW